MCQLSHMIIVSFISLYSQCVRLPHLNNTNTWHIPGMENAKKNETNHVSNLRERFHLIFNDRLPDDEWKWMTTVDDDCSRRSRCNFVWPICFCSHGSKWTVIFSCVCVSSVHGVIRTIITVHCAWLTFIGYGNTEPHSREEVNSFLLSSNQRDRECIISSFVVFLNTFPFHANWKPRPLKKVQMWLLIPQTTPSSCSESSVADSCRICLYGREPVHETVFAHVLVLCVCGKWEKFPDNTTILTFTLYQECQYISSWGKEHAQSLKRLALPQRYTQTHITQYHLLSLSSVSAPYT